MASDHHQQMTKAEARALDFEEFAKCFAAVLENDGRTDLSAELWEFYYEELGGMPRADLRHAIREYMRAYKGFPKVPHLRPQAKPKTQQARRGDHPELGVTTAAAWNLLDARIDGKPEKGGTYPIDVSGLVDHWLAHYEDMLQTMSEREARSRARGSMSVNVQRLFDAVA